MKVNGGVILETIKNPALEVFKKWSEKVKNVVGEGNYAMERSESVAPGKKKYARIFFKTRAHLFINVAAFIATIT